MDNYSNSSNMTNSPSPDFQKLAQTIESNIQKISQNVSSMQKMVNQFNTSQDSHEVRSQFQQIQNYTQQLARDTSLSLKSMMTLSGQPHEQQQQKLNKERLSQEFFAVLNLFQATQRTAAQKTKDDLRRNKKVHLADPFALGHKNQELIELESTARDRVQMQEQMPTEEEIREYEEREQAVLELERNITSVNEFFKELSSTIHEQSGMIDSIEANIELTSHNVEQGTDQLRQAANSQTKSRKKKLFLIVVFAIIIAILFIVIFSH